MAPGGVRAHQSHVNSSGCKKTGMGAVLWNLVARWRSTSVKRHRILVPLMRSSQKRSWDRVWRCLSEMPLGQTA